MKQFKFCFTFGVCVAAAQLVSAQTIFDPFPSRIVGQPFLQQVGLPTSIAPNLVEGREMYAPQGIAVDTSVNPPILYVADYFNSRVLAFKNASNFQKGDYADLIIGQRDRFTTVPKGPGTDLTTGLFLPVAVVVDKSGNLYVADSGNNRIVRYLAPFQQPPGTQVLPVDMILGQKDFNSRTPNQGLANPTEKTLAISGQLIGMAFDGSGNLWLSDGGNNRVLRYPAAALSQAAFDPAADLVLGQPDFVTTTIPKTFTVTEKDILQSPGALAFSPSGLLFVADSANDSVGTGGRVMVYSTPFATGQSAARIMGISPLAVLAKGAAPPALSVISQSTFASPSGMFFIGDAPFIVDTGKSRIDQFDPFSSWPLEATSFSPLAQKAYGQSGWELPGAPADLPNAGQPTSSDSNFALPVGAVLVGTDLIIADGGNNRVIAIPQFPTVTSQTAQFPFFRANRLVGQLDFKYNSPNLIEGREVSFSVGGGSLALDLASPTLHLYVADPLNNRVLGFKDARTMQAGQMADIVIGQPDFMTAVRNFPGVVVTSNSDLCPPGSQTDNTLCAPAGVAVDSKGDLWVADTGNGRVLRFPKPFDQASVSMPHANLVIGQTSFTTKITDPSSQTMSQPDSVAFTADGHLVVADFALSRVLFFRRPSSGDFVIGQAAANVIGQPDFQPGQAVEANPLSGPRGIAVDPSFDRLYIADTGNNRIVVYRNLPTAERDPAPSIILRGDGNGSFNRPIGVAVDQVTGELWVADTGNNRTVRFPSFDTLLTDPTANFILNCANIRCAPVGLTLDAYGNPAIAEGLNRVALYYHALGSNSGNCSDCSGNASNYVARFAPGMLATLKPSKNSGFGTDTASASSVPLPAALADIEVVVGANLPSGGVIAPLLYVSPHQINFQFPSTIAVGSQAEIDVVKVSTSQILAAWLYKIESVSPGLFTADSSGAGQCIAQNQDGVTNDSAHPAKAGSTVVFYGTGQGLVMGGPPDGTTPAGPVPATGTTRVLINGFDASVAYSGLAPGLVGVWQLNVVVPMNVPPGPVGVIALVNDIPSNIDPFTGARTTCTIRVTQ